MCGVGTGHIRLDYTAWWLTVTGVTGHGTDIDATVEVTCMIACIGIIAMAVITVSAGGVRNAISGSEGSWRDGMTVAANND